MEEPVAKWEIWSVAMMLVATHGDDAEQKAEHEIADAEMANDIGALSVWRAIRSRLDEIRTESGRKP